MAHSAYDLVLYPTYPRSQTHPDCLASIATAWGMRPAPVTRCRVLELGCGDGGNLAPLAYALPQSQFCGVDSSSAALKRARRMTEALRLSNVRWLEADLREIGPGFGEYDYIIAHGLYSWAPSEVRDHLLWICRECLAPEGVAFVSYNCYPGAHIRRVLQGMLQYHVRGIQEPRRAIDVARQYLRFFRKAKMPGRRGQALLDHEARAMLERDDAGLFHDDLATIQEPAWFHEFAAHAQRYDLQYLGEAELHEMFDHRNALQAFQGDILEREQYLDFLKLRRFRQSLLCHGSVRLDRGLNPEKMDLFLFSASGRGVAIAAGEGPARNVAYALQDLFPLPAPFEELVPYAGTRKSLREILFSMVMAGFANLHVHDFPCADSVSERPRASAVARYQAEHSTWVTSLRHLVVEPSDGARQVIPLLDGTRTAAELGPGAEWLPWLAEAALLEA
jgi:SAM-dependent methyltransferase